MKTSAEVAKNVVGLLLKSKNVEFVSPYFNWRLIEADHDDDKFVDCAFAANATYIVSNDKHLDVLKKVPFPKNTCFAAHSIPTTLAKLNDFEPFTASCVAAGFFMSFPLPRKKIIIFFDFFCIHLILSIFLLFLCIVHYMHTQLKDNQLHGVIRCKTVLCK